MRDYGQPEAPEETGDIMAGDRRLSRPDSSLPDWEMPDGSYRPVPIVWFAGAFLLQMAALTIVFLLLITVHPIFTVAAAILITAWIGKWTWERGMAAAGTGWKSATLIVLGAQSALIIFTSLQRL